MKIINILNKKKIRTSLFIDPTINNIKISKELNSNCIELHTGKLAGLVKQKKIFINELNKIKKCAKYAFKTGLEVHAGHGMDYKTAKILNSVKKTGRILVVEDGWENGSIASEIITRITEKGIKLKSPPQRICWPNSHVPMSSVLEKDFYFVHSYYSQPTDKRDIVGFTVLLQHL